MNRFFCVQAYTILLNIGWTVYMDEFTGLVFDVMQFRSFIPNFPVSFFEFSSSVSHLTLIGSSCAFTRTLCSSDSQLWTSNDEPVNRGNRHQINVDTLWPPEKQNVEKWNWNCGCWKLDARWPDYNIFSGCILFVFQLSRNHTLIVFMNYQR